ncbi:aminopeptidase N [Microbacterium halophytorum]|uniref:aminopeptidase N n=1 Tax=Microbacterium halophytorum TaxID=2067568 RepID=UPI000CFC8BF4|nr:aminopeptidase N [Microbacterium halophytorum]
MTNPNASANLTREETAARAAAIRLRAQRVFLDVTSAPEPDATGFGVTCELDIETEAPETWVDFLGEAVSEVSVNGERRDVEWDGARIRVTGLASGSSTIRIVAAGAYSRSGEGLHRFVDPVDGETYLYTQYEPADSRRVNPCFEQPDMKAPWTFEITAPAGWTLLNNAPAAERHDDGGRQTVRFAETLPIPSYITAVAAGPYHRVAGEWARDGQRVELGVLCRASLAEHLDAENILEVTRQGLGFFDDAFAYPYPWGKYDQIFVPEYNLGAMENPGLVTFTESYVFRGAATRAQHEGRANTILHEMAHMWFGDLATMRWWDDLWLKESFADYMGSHASAAATEYTDAWVSFANRRKAWAYQADQLPTTHPIVADIPDLEAAKLNFDGITYAKGASVLKQLVAFVGEEAFFEAARRYFAAHAFGSTTLDDLLAPLAEVSGRDVRGWASAWLETSGMSTLAVDRDGEGAALTQTDPRPHRVGVGLYRMTGGRLSRTSLIDLDIRKERTAFAGLTAAAVRGADLVLPNDGDLSYAKARLDARSVDAAAEALSTIDDDLARGLVWSALWNATRDGELPAARYLEIVRRHAPAEAHVGLLTQTLANAGFAVGHYVPDAAKRAEERTWLEATWQGMGAATPGSDAQLAWARALAAAASRDAHRADEIRGMLDGRGVPAGLPLDADLRWSLLTALAATGRATEADAAAELERDDTLSGRTAWVEVMASRPEADVRAAAWEAAWTDAALSNDHLQATIDGVAAGGRRDLIERFDADYFARLRETWATRSIEIARRLVRDLFPQRGDLALADAWLAENEDAPGSLRRLVIEQRDHLRRDLEVRAANA